jgi:hypothetical protein
LQKAKGILEKVDLNYTQKS